jgi:hypothetical protein
MTDPKKFSDGFLQNPGPSSRGIADEPPVPLEQEESPKAEEMIDALYYVLMARLDRIEEQLKTIIDVCQNPKSHS